MQYDVLTGRITSESFIAENMKFAFKKFGEYINNTISTFEN